MGPAYSNYLIMLERDRKREQRILLPENIFHTQQLGCVSSALVLYFTASVKDRLKQQEAQTRLVLGSTILSLFKRRILLHFKSILEFKKF